MVLLHLFHRLQPVMLGAQSHFGTVTGMGGRSSSLWSAGGHSSDSPGGAKFTLKRLFPILMPLPSLASCTTRLASCLETISTKVEPYQRPVFLSGIQWINFTASPKTFFIAVASITRGKFPTKILFDGFLPSCFALFFWAFSSAGLALRFVPVDVTS